MPEQQLHHLEPVLLAGDVQRGEAILPTEEGVSTKHTDGSSDAAEIRCRAGATDRTRRAALSVCRRLSVEARRPVWNSVTSDARTTRKHTEDVCGSLNPRLRVQPAGL